jgi:hypothetical protein
VLEEPIELADMKLPSKAWLRFDLTPQQQYRTLLRCCAWFQPRGLAGEIYWCGLYPVHVMIFFRDAEGDQEPRGTELIASARESRTLSSPDGAAIDESRVCERLLQASVAVDVYGHLVPGANIAWVDRLDAKTSPQQNATPAQPEVKKPQMRAQCRRRKSLML